MKKTLLEEVSLILLRDNFIVKSITRGFDLIARKEDKVFLIKILEDASSLNELNAKEMLDISPYFNAIPLIIANKINKNLEDNVVYSRFNINVINLETLKNSLNKELPLVRSTKAGLTLVISQDKLNNKIEEKDLSLKELADKLNLSRTTIIKYKQGSYINLNNALKLYNHLGNIFNEIDLFNLNQKIEDKFNTEVGGKYSLLGFNVNELNKCSFDLISKRDNEIILTKVGDKVSKDFEKISNLLEVDDLVIFSKKKPKDFPSLKKEEFLEIEKAKELIKIVKEK